MGQRIAQQLIARGKHMTSKKSTSKKSTAKKSTAKKASSRKKATKKTGAKKTTRKKATAKKTAKQTGSKKAAFPTVDAPSTPKKETKMISASGDVATITRRTWNSPPAALFKPQGEAAAATIDTVDKTVAPAASNLPSLMAQDSTKTSSAASPSSHKRPIVQVLGLSAGEADCDPQDNASSRRRDSALPSRNFPYKRRVHLVDPDQSSDQGPLIRHHPYRT